MPAHKAHSGEGDRTFVAALTRCLDVLRAFRAGDNLLGNNAISLRTGLPNSTMLRGETLANPPRETV